MNNAKNDQTREERRLAQNYSPTLCGRSNTDSGRVGAVAAPHDAWYDGAFHTAFWRLYW